MVELKNINGLQFHLSIHGVIVKANGEKIEVNIGEDEEDPIFTITDLLPHLAQEQMEKN